MNETELSSPVEMPEFDELARLARENPEQFETVRAELLEQCIQCAPPRMHRRLRGLVFELNASRQTAKSPLAACLSASGRMWESFDTLRLQLNALARPEALSEEEMASLMPKAQQADVLQFDKSEPVVR